MSESDQKSLEEFDAKENTHCAPNRDQRRKHFDATPNRTKQTHDIGASLLDYMRPAFRQRDLVLPQRRRQAEAYL